MAFLRPPPEWSIASATFGAVDGITRGLAVIIGIKLGVKSPNEINIATNRNLISNHISRLSLLCRVKKR